MTDKQLRQAVGRVLLPQYEAMIPEHDEHRFSDDFEADMSELIGTKGSKIRRRVEKKDDADRKKSIKVSRRVPVMIAAMFALVIGLGALGLLFYDRSVKTDESQSPGIAVQSASQTDSVSDEQRQKQLMLSELGKIASQLENESEKFYVCCICNAQQEVYCYRQESIDAHKSSAAARSIGECLRKSKAEYLGSTKLAPSDDQNDGSEYRVEPYESTVSYDIQKIFDEFSDRYFVKICLCEFNSAVFSAITYTVVDGTGYLRIEINDPFHRTTEFNYFSFKCEKSALFNGEKPVLSDWTTDQASSEHSMSRQDLYASDGTQKLSIANYDRTAGFSFSVDNTGEMPAVNISDIKLPKGETPENAVLEIYLCVRNAPGGTLINSAVMSGTLKEGRYDFSQYKNSIAKTDIDGIKIIMRFDTDKHPAPDQSVEKSGLKSAYTIMASFVCDD